MAISNREARRKATLDLLNLGWRVDGVALVLGISESTVKRYRNRAGSKYFEEARATAQAAAEED